MMAHAPDELPGSNPINIFCSTLDILATHELIWVHLLRDRLIRRLTQGVVMDYSEILIQLDQHTKLYLKAILKQELDIAQVHSRFLLELAAELLVATKGMK
jgi:hypothetical protein